MENENLISTAMSICNTLPGSIRIAAKCEAIDKVIVEPANEKPSHTYNPTIRTLCIFDWENRLVKKSVKHLTERINDFCEHSTNKPIFNPWIMYNPVKKGIWIYNEMIYDMKYN